MTYIENIEKIYQAKANRGGVKLTDGRIYQLNKVGFHKAEYRRYMEFDGSLSECEYLTIQGTYNPDYPDMTFHDMVLSEFEIVPHERVVTDDYIGRPLDWSKE